MGVLELAQAALRYALFALVVAVLLRHFLAHPLRKYPGPFLAKVTYAYSGYHVFKKRPHINIFRNFQKYGDVYRPAPNRLLFNSVTAVKEIYLNPKVLKGQSYRHPRWDYRPNTFDVIDREEHRRKRKVIGHVLSDKSLRTFQPAMIAQVDIFLRILGDSSGPVDMSKVCKRLALDVISYLAFGYELKAQTQETNRFIWNSLINALYMTNMYYAWPAFSTLAPVIRGLAKSQVQSFWSAVKDMIVSRIAEPQDAKPDFYATAVHGLDSVGIEGSELWSEALLFISAGGTTVATGLSGLFFNLSRHPDVYARLAVEIRGTFSSSDDICHGPKLASCKYLRAVIDESLRLSPASLFPTWRQAENSAEPFVVDGRVIPPGTEVAVHSYSMLHNDKYFPEPFSFRPERWLEDSQDDSEATQSTMRLAHVVFGTGERTCAGKSLAYMEISVTIAKTLWFFDFARAPGEIGKVEAGRGREGDPWAAPDQFQMLDVFVPDHDGPNLIFTPREGCVLDSYGTGVSEA